MEHLLSLFSYKPLETVIHASINSQLDYCSSLLCFASFYRLSTGPWEVLLQVIKLVSLRSCWQPEILRCMFSCCSRVRTNSQRWEQFAVSAPGLDLPEEIRAANFLLIISESLLRACLFVWNLICFIVVCLNLLCVLF